MVQGNPCLDHFRSGTEAPAEELATVRVQALALKLQGQNLTRSDEILVADILGPDQQYQAAGKILRRSNQPAGRLGTDNIIALTDLYAACDKIICAWGNNMVCPQNTIDMMEDKLYYLEKSKSGIPKHPLYLKGTLKPIKL